MNVYLLGKIELNKGRFWLTLYRTKSKSTAAADKRRASLAAYASLAA